MELEFLLASETESKGPTVDSELFVIMKTASANRTVGAVVWMRFRIFPTFVVVVEASILGGGRWARSRSRDASRPRSLLERPLPIKLAIEKVLLDSVC